MLSERTSERAHEYGPAARAESEYGQAVGGRTVANIDAAAARVKSRPVEVRPAVHKVDRGCTSAGRLQLE